MELRRDYYPLEEIVGAVLQRMERHLERREVTTSLPDNLPLVYADDVLLGQLFVEPAGERGQVHAGRDAHRDWSGGDADAVVLEIRDRGPGFGPERRTRIFEKFYRGKSEGVARRGPWAGDLPRDRRGAPGHD